MAADDLAAQLGALISTSHATSSRPVPTVISAPGAPAPPPAAPRPPLALNEGQAEAVSRINDWRRDPSSERVMGLTGAAGTGKTTVTQAIRERLRGTRIVWGAMTGKAASRMRAAAGVNAKTMHSVLYHAPREVDDEVNQKIDLDFDMLKREYSQAECLFVIDESSMISPKIRADIERSSYGKILLIGDPYQIPPVLSKNEERDRGDDYSVFTGLPTAHLTEVMRAQGAVLHAATHVREQQEILRNSITSGGSTYDFTEAALYDVAVGIAIQRWLDDPEDHVIITWTNSTRMLISKVIRAKLGHTSDLPDPDEPMIVRRNIYGTDLMNGDYVKIEEWMSDGPTLCGIPTRFARVRGYDGTAVILLITTNRFDGVLPYVPLQDWRRAIEKADVPDPTPLTFGTCLTGHLAQGSEYRRVTTVLPGDLRNPVFNKTTTLPNGQNMSFKTRWLYTSLARAKNHSSLIIS